MAKYCLIALFVLVIILQPQNVESRSCFTQSGQEGTCSSVFRCPSVTHPFKISFYTICWWRRLIPIICCLKRRESRRLSSPSLRGTNDSTGVGSRLNLTVIGPPIRHVVPIYVPPATPNQTILTKNCGYGVQPDVTKIVNGAESKVASWPWMAVIYIKRRRRFYFLCGGSLINDRYIVTAAHCFKTRDKNDGLKPENFEVRLGEHNLVDTNFGARYQVERVINHEDYSPPSRYNDIALIKIRGRVNYTETVSPVCLNALDISGDLTGTPAVVIGWGAIYFSGRDSPVLREVVIPITDTAYCDRSYRRLRSMRRSYRKGITSSIVCAGLKKGGKDSCQNDSGGPLMVFNSESSKWSLVGIVSAGYQCARPNTPGIYTRTSYYLEWMSQNMK